MGKYKFSRRIGRGGMAEVFLSMQEGIGGFEKLVVVKRIFSQFCEDERFIRMFLDEARLAASIRHQNVVQILDIGRDDDGYFIVMEYLSGESLAYLFEALRVRNETPPASMVCRVGASLAAGLHYAHTATDAAGNPQPIVHRDVTPSNLIISYNGVIKIVDFGVAKATLTEGNTRAGAVKGKMSYLTPEQIDDRDVDGRTDIFQLGICLHELLTGRRLFHGETDHHKMMAVMERRIPAPSDLNPTVPRVLDDVVLGALQRDPDKRPQSADLLRRQLEGVLSEIGATASEHEVGEWMRQTFPDRHAERLKLERDSVAQMRSGQPLADSGPLLATPGSGTGRRTPTMATVLNQSKKGSSQTGTDTRMGLSRRGWALAAIVAVGLAVISIVAFRRGRVVADSETAASDTAVKATAGVTVGSAQESATAPAEQAAAVAAPTVRISIHALPSDAVIAIDGIEVGRGLYTAEYEVDGRLRTVQVSAPGYMTRQIEVTNVAIDEVVQLEPVGAPAESQPTTKSSKAARRSVAIKPKPGVVPPDSVQPAEPAPRRKDPEDDWPRKRTDNLDPWK